MAASKKPQKPAASLKRPRLIEADPADVGRRVDEAIALLSQVGEALGALEELREDARKFSNGRLRDTESKAISTVLNAADAYPHLFVALAAKDHGVNDEVFETQPTRDDLARRDHLARLAGALDPIADGVSDTLLALGSRVREVSTPMYAIARVAATVHPKLRAALAPATKVYGAAAAKAQQTRRAKKAKAPKP